MSSETPPDISSDPPPRTSIETPLNTSAESASAIEPGPDTSVEPSLGIEAAPDTRSDAAQAMSSTTPAISGQPSPLPLRRSSTSLLIRLIVEGLLGVLLVGFLVFSGIDQRERANQLLASEVATQQGQLTDQQSQIDALQAEVKDLKERWYGSPALFSPPAIGNTDINFFPVTGTTQAELLSSLNHSTLCTTHTCNPDPLVPGGITWALAGATGGGGYYCYSPASTTLAYREFVVLPQWSPPLDGTVKIPLVQTWNALAQVLYTHEAGHVAISQQDIAALNDQAHQLASCSALISFWSSPSVFDQLNADQAAYHARLRADCRPEIGCIPPGWMGW